MLSVFLFGLRESIHRRMGLVLLIVGTVITLTILSLLSFDTAPDGTLMARTVGGMSAPASQTLPTLFEGFVLFASTLWIFIVLFATAPLLTSYLEAGWVELTVSKGVRRWEYLVARYCSTVALMSLALLLFPGIIGLYFWLRAGAPPLWNQIGAYLLLVLSFSAVLALMSFVATFQLGPILPIMAGYLLLAFSAMLKNREAIYPFVSWKWVQGLFDWTYYILPKTSELASASQTFLSRGELTAWWPIWTTALFLLAMVGLACLLFQRKSF